MLAVSFAAPAQEGSLRIIADTDTPVPGLEGASFMNFGQLVGVDPGISGRNVVFGACCPGGIYALIDDELRVIANTQSTFPGTDHPLGVFLAYGSGPSIDGENVAFACADGQPGPSAICTYINGSPGFVAKGGVTLIPGSTQTYGTYFAPYGASPSISGENVAFTAKASSGIPNGIYARIDGELVTIADSTMPVPGQEGLIFQNFGQLSGSSPSISGGNVAFVGKWPEGAGAYAYIDGELRMIADSTTTGGSFGLKGGGPSISGENVAFLASASVYAYINGELRVIADHETPAPGTTGTFGAFPVSPVIRGENVGFGAGTNIGGGVFAYIDGVIQLIADRNTPAPGHEETTFDGFFLVDRPNFDGEGVRPAISGENVVFIAQVRLPGELNQFVTGVYGRLAPPPPIPAVSPWWLIVFALLVLSAGIVLVRRRREIRCTERQR